MKEVRLGKEAKEAVCLLSYPRRVPRLAASAKSVSVFEMIELSGNEVGRPIGRTLTPLSRLAVRRAARRGSETQPVRLFRVG